MINANDLRKTEFSKAENGFSIEEVNSAIDEAAKTIEAYVNENSELYHKMEVLASKIEEYRAEEDSIKTALITAQKMADKIESESKDEAEVRLKESSETAQKTVSEANEKAEKIISEAREYSSNLINEKTEEANALISEAEAKANEAINSAKIVAQNILDQAKEISDDLIAKSKEEKEAYELLIGALKKDAASFIENLKALYSEQLDALNSAKLETSTASEDEVNSIHSEVDSLVSEISEIEEAIPEDISLEEKKTEEEPKAEPVEEPADEADEEKEFTIIDEEENEEDPMEAVEAFSKDEITPVDTSKAYIPEIEEEAQMEDEEEKDDSLFEEDTKLPFENYFHVNNKDAHGDKTQTISLVPPEEDENNEDEPKFKGFFKKRN